jgi:hypothetical protein
VFPHQNAGQSGTKIGNRLFENVAQLKYFETTVISQILNYEKIKRRLNSGNDCYHSVHYLLSSRLLSKNLKIRIYHTLILSVILLGGENWSLI